MKRYFQILLFAVLLAAPTAWAAEKSISTPLFHPPQTEAEKALDEIVKTSITRPDMFPIILQNPKYDLSKTDDFTPFFTDAFLDAWRKFERGLVNQYCQGKYQPGKNCGYDINPISCAPHLASPYFYRTIMGDDSEALMALAPADDMTDRHIYYMKHEKGRWKLGGLYCDEEIPDTIPEKELMKKFRQPKYESEKKLESLFKRARTDKDMIPFMLDLPWYDQSKKKEFSQLFTPALLYAWKIQAKVILHHDCSAGYYEEGKGSCDIFPNLISCGIRENDLFVISTAVEGEKNSVITYSYPGGHPKLQHIYHMIKDDAGWKIDGVWCDKTHWFNMKQTAHPLSTGGDK